MTEPKWIRSTRCSEAGCAEVALDGDLVKMRNSEKPEQGVMFWGAKNWEIFLAWIMSGYVNQEVMTRLTGLEFTLKEWVDFCDGARRGEFEITTLARAIDKD